MRIAMIGAPLLLSACIPASPAQDAPAVQPALARDRTQPVLALAEHILDGYFSGDTTAFPTTCLIVGPAPLSDEQEEELILRFERLAPARRCRPEGAGHVDTITDDPAAVVQLYNFACATGDRCSGWASVPGQPATRQDMRFEQGEWRFTADRRILGE